MFSCELCSKNFTQKVTLEYHLINNVCIKDDIVHKCIQCDKTYKSSKWLHKHMVTCNNTPNSVKIHQVQIPIHQNTPEIHQNTLEFNQNILNKFYKCMYCQRQFTRSDSLGIHIKSRCKVKKDTEYNNKELLKILLIKDKESKLKEEKLEKEKAELIKLLVEKAGSTTNVYTTNIGNTTTQNTQQNNNIQINGFGKEDISYLTDSNKVNICESIYGSVAKCIEAIHLNDKHPENKNIRMRSHKRGDAQACVNKIEKFDHKKQKWQISNLNEGVKELIDVNYDRVLDFYDEIAKSKMSSYKNSRFENFVKDMKDELPEELL